uniref:Ecdysone-induced protein 78C n=1 Tax=Plectus sambesii TaxID=2011161 RepID=A0A914UU07_9BILA
MVFRLNRNRCQYCRFKKCLAVGMSRDSVRYGRVPKRSRERLQDDARVSSMTGDAEADSELEKKQLALYDIILSVSQAHHSNCNYTDDKIKNLTHRPMHFPLEQCQLNEADALGSTVLREQQKIIMWQTLSAKVLPEIQHVVEFAKRIPGFADLEQDDQLILIKAGFFEVWLIRVARMFNPQSCSLTFCDGSVVSRDQLEVIYNSELVSAMAVFTTSFNNLHLNDGEIGLFSAIILLSSDRPKVKQPDRVESLQEKLVEALKLQLSRSRSSDPQLYGNLLAKVAELRAVGLKHTEVLEWFQSNCHRLSLPALYAEIYNIHM